MKSYSHFFFSKNTYEFDIVLTRTVYILTTYELVKLTYDALNKWALNIQGKYDRIFSDGVKRFCGLTTVFVLFCANVPIIWVFCVTKHQPLLGILCHLPDGI